MGADARVVSRGSVSWRTQRRASKGLARTSAKRAPNEPGRPSEEVEISDTLD